MQASPFVHLDLGNLLVMLGLVLSFTVYVRDRKKDNEERTQVREKTAAAAATMHEENKHRLETLGQFHTYQVEVNLKRDEQISQLTTQTARLAEMASGFNRRLELMENRRV